MKKAELTIPTILGILILMAGLISGVYFLRSPLRSLVGASAEESPKEVKIANTTDISFVVSWITSTSTSGFIQYNEAGKNPNLIISDDRDLEKGSIGNYFTHFVTLKGLKPATKYNFKIGSGKNVYDQNGRLYETGTGVTLLSPPPANVAYGQVLTSAGDPAEGAIVYLNMVGMEPQATLVKSSGTWAIPISTARTADLTSFASYDKQNSKLNIFIQAADAGTKSLNVTTEEISPVQMITLGSVDVAIDPPPNTAPAVDNPDSKFSATAINPAMEATAAGQLLILTPQTNEKINTSRPEIIGKGPAKSSVTIKIHSNEVITQTVQTDAQGNFSYDVPADLSPGEHTITISSLVNGVMKMVTKTFIVEAAGESLIPARSATPSASIKPSPIPTVPPRVVIPSTESGTPESGNLTPTLLLIILGAGLTMSGLFAYKRIN